MQITLVLILGIQIACGYCIVFNTRCGVEWKTLGRGHYILFASTPNNKIVSCAHNNNLAQFRFGDSGGGVSRSVSTSTTIRNGRKHTVRMVTIRNPDGTEESTVEEHCLMAAVKLFNPCAVQMCSLSSSSLPSLANFF
jgi:hypothetical protein